MIFLSERTVLLFEPNKAFASVQNILTVSKIKNKHTIIIDKMINLQNW